MAGSYSYDGTLLDVVGQGVAVDGDWFEVLNGGSSERRASNIQFNLGMPAGTGTWVLEGRNGPNDSPIQLDTGTAAKTASYPRMSQMRLRWTAAAGLTARGSVNAVLKNLIYTPFAIQSPIFGGQALVSDTFTRTNGASPGIADTGQVWSARNGVWSTNGTQLVAPATSAPVVVLDSGAADCTIQVDGVVEPSGQQDIVFRASGSDDQNLWIVGFHSGSGIMLFKRVAGTFTQMAGPFVQPSGIATLKVVLSGSNIQVFRNGVLITSLSDGFNATATQHGCYGIGGVFDNFTVTVP